MVPVKTIPGVVGGRDKREWWEGEFKCEIFNILEELL
jgi:hypothetical protein